MLRLRRATGADGMRETGAGDGATGALVEDIDAVIKNIRDERMRLKEVGVLEAVIRHLEITIRHLYLSKGDIAEILVSLFGEVARGKGKELPRGRMRYFSIAWLHLGDIVSRAQAYAFELIETYAGLNVEGDAWAREGWDALERIKGCLDRQIAYQIDVLADEGPISELREAMEQMGGLGHLYGIRGLTDNWTLYSEKTEIGRNYELFRHLHKVDPQRARKMAKAAGLSFEDGVDDARSGER